LECNEDAMIGLMRVVFIGPASIIWTLRLSEVNAHEIITNRIMHYIAIYWQKAIHLSI
jgi:hypothetical protein